jgi:hypothetical protein
MNTVLPFNPPLSSSSPRSRDCNAVCAARGMEAAWLNVRVLGFKAVVEAVERQYSASEPLQSDGVRE